jgi:PAS domain S-box-containing protein
MQSIEIKSVESTNCFFCLDEFPNCKFIHTSSEGVAIVNRQNELTFVNENFAGLYGYKAGDMLGKKVECFLEEEDIESHQARFEKRRAGISEKYEEKHRKRDGGYIWLIVDITPLFDKDGSYNGALAIVTDITEHKQYEELLFKSQEALKESEEKLRIILENTNDYIGLMDFATKNFIYMSPNMKEFIGFTERELKDLKYEDIFKYIHPDDISGHIEYVEKILSGQGFPSEMEYRYKTKSGEYFLTTSSSACLFSSPSTSDALPMATTLS